MRERWGTFSVRDHLTAAPFVTEVLLYDRLVVPVPPDNAPPETFWDNFNPELQARCLDILGKKTETADGLALTIPWDDSKRERFSSRMSVASALATQQRIPDQMYYMDPFEMTRQLIKEEFRPALPRGISHAWVLAAFSSAESYEADLTQNRTSNTQRQLAARIAHKFLTPKGPDTDQELLKRAVDLSMSDEFRRKRANLYHWQESVLRDELSEDKAIEELDSRLKQYNSAINKAFKDVYHKYAYTVIPITLAMGGAITYGTLPAIFLAGVAARECRFG